MKTKILALLALGTCLTVVGCDDPSEPDDELRDMIELCEELEDCDAEIDAMLDEADAAQAGADANLDGDLVLPPGCTHCDDRDDFTVEGRPTHTDTDWDDVTARPDSTHDEGLVGADDLLQPERPIDPDPAPPAPGSSHK